MQTAKVAVLLADGFDGSAVALMTRAVKAAGGMAKIVAPHGGTVTGEDGKELAVDFSLPTVCSVLFDAVYVAGGEASAQTLRNETRAIEFIEEAYKHCKAIAATGAGRKVIAASRAEAGLDGEDLAVVAMEDGGASKVASAFIKAISAHRNWDRELETLKIG
jgi:catalase